MKRFAWVLGTIFLVLTLMFVGCAAEEPTTPAPTTSAEPPNITSTEGTLGEVNVGGSTVTVETPRGPETFRVGPNTNLTFGGTSCTLAELEDLEASGEYFDCTVVYDDEGNLYAVNVYRLPPPASVRGSISDINITDSTVTVQTAEGDKVFDVDPTTGLLIGGTVCSLELVNALLEGGGDLPCTVIYSEDEQGDALYIDITSPPDFTQGTGTISEVDVEKSTVTILTDTGERTFEVDARTGQFLNGEVCSLEEIQEAAQQGDFLYTCQVMYYTDADGNLVYLDISS